MGLSAMESVTFEDGAITDGLSSPDATVIDATGYTLMPVLIDAHVHLYREQDLRQAS